MATTLTFDGLEDLKRALRSLPDDLHAECGHKVHAAANATVAAIKAKYGAHRRTGHLVDAVDATVDDSRFGTSALIAVKDEAAWWFENGTQARHWINGKLTGTMPAYPIFLPTITKERRRMYEEQKDILQRHGLVVRDV